MERIVFISYSSQDKPIADAICRQLKENGIQYWIDRRDIGPGLWADDIMDGLHRSEVFVVVVGHNSIASQEVLKEVTEATKTCKFILPFKVDDEMLSKGLQYHLGPYQWLDAATPPLEERIGELLECIEHLSEENAFNVNSGRMKLVEKVPAPHGFFVGREQEIAAIREAFQNDHIVFLQGMGGIGKSEIAKGYAQTYRSEYDTILLTSYTSGLLDLVCGEDIAIENLRRMSGEDSVVWFRRKLEALRSLVSERTLLIIDNFDTDTDPYMDEVFAMPCHILVTSRNGHPDYDSEIHVGPVEDFDTVRKIFAHYVKPLKVTDQESVDEILRLVGCHTITVELIAKQLAASRLTPAKMLDRLRSAGVDTKLKESVKHGVSAGKKNAFDYIWQLFTFSDLSEEEKHMLCVMSFAPVSGIQFPMLSEILDLDDFDVVNSLIGGSWLIDDIEAVRMHPVIRDVVRAELAPTPVTCLDYVEGLRKKSVNMWNFDLQERNDFYALVRQIVIDWPDPVPETLPAYDDLIDAVWMGGDFARAQAFGEKVYRYALETCGSAHYETGRSALHTAGAYHNAGDDITAEDWYRKAYEHMQALGGPVTATMGQACFKVGRCAVKRGDLEAAQPYYEKAVELYDDLLARKIFLPGRKYPDQYTDLIHDLARVERLKGNYERSIELEEQCCRQNIESFGHETVAFGNYYLGMGLCYSGLKDYAKADEYMQKALEICMKHYGAANLQTMDCRESIADSLLARGDREGAAAELNAMLLDLDKYFGERNPLTVRIREKADSLR